MSPQIGISILCGTLGFICIFFPLYVWEDNWSVTFVSPFHGTFDRLFSNEAFWLSTILVSSLAPPSVRPLRCAGRFCCFGVQARPCAVAVNGVRCPLPCATLGCSQEGVHCIWVRAPFLFVLGQRVKLNSAFHLLQASAVCTLPTMAWIAYKRIYTPSPVDIVRQEYVNMSFTSIPIDVDHAPIYFAGVECVDVVLLAPFAWSTRRAARLERTGAVRACPVWL